MLNLRKILIVDKKLQYSIIRYLVIYSTCLCLIFLSLLYFLTNRFLDKISQFNIDDKILISLFDDINYMAIGFFALVLLISLVSSYFSLFFSNKIAGPIYNMNKTLDQNRATQSKTLIKLRKSDYFVELSEKINLLIEKKS